VSAQAIDDVRQLAQWLAQTDIRLLELSGPGKVVRLRREGVEIVAETGAPAGVPFAHHQPTNSEIAVVRAGSVGVFLQSHPLRAEPLLRVGQQVAAGQVIALLKIGLVLLGVTAPRAGVVTRIIAAHESTVGFGAPLIELSEQGTPWTST
jgi:acetyl-CoA carboxylase biotin carboxyl carrier protein